VQNGTELNLITAVQVLRPKAGDVFVITANERLTVEQMDHLSHCAKQALPPGVKVLVLDIGLKANLIQHL
jgi:predicted peroxiredoxin